MGRIDRQQVGPLYCPKWVQDPIQVSSSPIGSCDKSESIFLPVIMRRDWRTSQEMGSGNGTESGNSGLLFPAIPSAKKNGKLRPVIDLSLLNQYINKQHFKMETVKSVRQSIMANDWAVSIYLTDAYIHVPIHPISRKYLRLVYEHQIFQYTALPFRMSLSVDFHDINGSNSSALMTTCHISLPISRRLAYKRSDSQSTSLSHKILPSNGTKSRFHTKSKEVRFNTSTEMHLYRYGISDSTKHSQGTSRPSRNSYSDYQNNSLSDSKFRHEISFLFWANSVQQRT